MHQPEDRRESNCKTESPSSEHEDLVSSLVSTDLLMTLKKGEATLPKGGSFDCDRKMILIEEETSTELVMQRSEYLDKIADNKAVGAENEPWSGGADGKINAEGNDHGSSTSPVRSSNFGDEGEPGNGTKKEKESEGDVEEVSIEDEKSCWDGINKFRKICGRMVNNPYVQVTMIIFIFINAAMMGWATFPYVKDNDTRRTAFEICDLVFLIIFTIELFFQFIYLGFRLIFDPWLNFDLVIISISWITINQAAGLQIFRAFRIFRTFRLITRVKVMRDLLTALGSVVPRMSAIILMLFLILYIFAVMFTQLFADAGEIGEFQQNYFGTMQDTALTLFQMMTMDGWADINRGLMDAGYPYSPVLIIAFVIISGFIVVNLIVAVICDGISDLEDDEKQKLGFGGENASADYEEPIELREQLDMIEDQIGDLTRIQAQTFHTLSFLSQQLQAQKEKRDKPNDSDDDKPNDSSKPAGGKSNPNGNHCEDIQKPSGQSDTRQNYRDMWTQEGSMKRLRNEAVSTFAKAASDLKKVRESEGKMSYEPSSKTL